MDKIIFILVLFLFSCGYSSRESAIIQIVNYTWKDKKIVEGNDFYEIKPSVDSVYFNIDSLRKKCKKVEYLSFINPDTVNLFPVSIQDHKDFFMKVNHVSINSQEDFGEMRNSVDSYYYTLEDTSYLNYNDGSHRKWYYQYIETDSLFIFNLVEYEFQYYINNLYILNKANGLLLNSFDESHLRFEKRLMFNWDKNGELFLDVEDTLDLDAKDGSFSEIWKDSLRIKMNFFTDGTIKWHLIFAKDRMLQASY